MEAVILAAGVGKRLYPLTKKIPKALFPIDGSPVIEYILKKLRSLDLKRINIVTNDKYYSNLINWVENYHASVPIVIKSDGTRNQRDKLGAVGDLKFILKSEKIKDDILLLVSDMVFSFKLEGFLSSVKKRKDQNWLLLYRLKDREQASNYGILSLDKDNKVIRFQEKPKVPFSSLIAFGIYYLPRSKLSMVNEFYEREGSMDVLGGYFRYLAERDSLYGFVQRSGSWADIGGSIECYRKAIEVVSERRNF
ncbi:MAG: nucleotidyltransferase family protein [Candidatus Kaelpia imicola]|nr:nucleotidyltransferase family protein [Candidatus Kaelpia imicola]